MDQTNISEVIFRDDNKISCHHRSAKSALKEIDPLHVFWRFVVFSFKDNRLWSLSCCVACYGICAYNSVAIYELFSVQRGQHNSGEYSHIWFLQITASYNVRCLEPNYIVKDSWLACVRVMSWISELCWFNVESFDRTHQPGLGTIKIPLIWCSWLTRWNTLRGVLIGITRLCVW